METVFIINPSAGKGNNIQKLIFQIEKIASQIEEKIEIYVTRYQGDARRFVREYCLSKGKARFIACGGDGTFSEVLNGAIDFPDTQIGVLPIGTGNDFCRNFKDTGDFSDIYMQIMGSSIKCDAIRYRSHLSGEDKTNYCANMFNIGFDCNVADMTGKMKKRAFISGSLAYILSIFAILIKKKGENLSIEIDGKKMHSGPLLLTSIANGSFCGGGIKSNPTSSVNDGFLNINIIYNISRLNFLTKLPFYIKGTHIKLRGIENVIFNTKGKKVTVTPHNNSMRLCVDGEIESAGKTEFEIVKDAFNFVIPTILHKESSYEKSAVFNTAF